MKGANKNGMQRNEERTKGMQCLKKEKGSEDMMEGQRARGERDGFLMGAPFWLHLLVFWFMMLAGNTGAASALCMCVYVTFLPSTQRDSLSLAHRDFCFGEIYCKCFLAKLLHICIK